MSNITQMIIVYLKFLLNVSVGAVTLEAVAFIQCLDLRQGGSLIKVWEMILTGAGSGLMKIGNIKEPSMSAREMLPYVRLQLQACLLSKWLDEKTFFFLMNLLWPSDARWWHGTGSILVQVMAWCLTAPSQYLNQCWLLICEVLWHSPESDFILSASIATLYDDFENYTFKITATSHRNQWIKTYLLKIEDKSEYHSVRSNSW